MLATIFFMTQLAKEYYEPIAQRAGLQIPLVFGGYVELYDSEAHKPISLTHFTDNQKIHLAVRVAKVLSGVGNFTKVAMVGGEARFRDNELYGKSVATSLLQSAPKDLKRAVRVPRVWSTVLAPDEIREQSAHRRQLLVGRNPERRALPDQAIGLLTFAAANRVSLSGETPTEPLAWLAALTMFTPSQTEDRVSIHCVSGYCSPVEMRYLEERGLLQVPPPDQTIPLSQLDQAALMLPLTSKPSANGSATSW